MTQSLDLDRKKAGFAILAVLLGASALVAGCYAPSPPMVAAQAAAQSSDVATVLEAMAHPCEVTLLDDERDLYPRGSGEEWFTLEQPCRLDTALTIRALAGELAIRLDGPGDFYLEHHAASITLGGAPPVAQQEGLAAPKGAYHYTYEATGKAHFMFRVEAGKP